MYSKHAGRCRLLFNRWSYHPGWIRDVTALGHSARPGSHVSAIKGMHGGGRVCYRDS